MTLRRQLLLVSLLLLSLPWAGCQFIREIESGLRDGQEQALQATAETIAATLTDRDDLLYPDTLRLKDLPDARDSVYAWPTEQPVIVDGYAEGWPEQRFRQYGNSDSSLQLRYQAMARQGRLYLLFQVSDPEIVFHNPALSPQPNGDRLYLTTWVQGRRQSYVISTAAPGRIRAQYVDRALPGTDPNRIRGVWQDTAQGYNLELEMPISLLGERLGFYLVDVAFTGSGTRTLGNTTALDTAAPPWLIHSPPALEQWLQRFIAPGTDIALFDKGGQRLAQLGSDESSSAAGSGNTHWLLRQLYRWALPEENLAPRPTVDNRGKLADKTLEDPMAGYGGVASYGDAASGDRALLQAAAPLFANAAPMGALLVAQSSERYLSLTDAAFSTLVGYSLSAIAVSALGLLAYASLLSWRIRRLSQAAETALDSDGNIDRFPRSRAKDEIGDLSRRYAELLDRVADYNQYLRTLSSKLAHELRTPIAVIQSSLDNLAHPALNKEERATYRQRAQEGLARLSRILTAMSEAAGLEDSLQRPQRERIELNAFLEELVTAYAQIHSDRRFTLTLSEPIWIESNPDLLAQALDKLVANAVSFTQRGKTIELGAGVLNDRVAVTVTNPGPLLPEHLGSQIFEPMVSLRETAESNSIHLGLGLHVVRLITTALGGTSKADNREDGSGVQITLILPGPIDPT
ncbi:ATP-binding protein [Halioglobus pacificus]|uniref:histidine kinase n=1 Tax=Parahalioglobus pacificus TaxID=930806 RepID=A0A918XE24_9GAMM|nr:ATP-binding protein [Halioglobus pacificus]GHD26684.1 proteobacterial dedicated sortase system histidine kinase [Halioglobus pacificus]